MKKLNLNLIIAIIALFANVGNICADTDKLTESAGWVKVTDLSSLTLSDYYFAFVDNDQDLMLSFEEGANQTTSITYRTMFYRTGKDAAMNPAMLWTLEADGTYYLIRNAEYQDYFLQTEWNTAWFCRTHDNGGGSTSWGDWIITIADGKYTIQNGKYPDSGYIGPWNNTIANGAEIAANKTGDAIGYFQIYAIEKSKVDWINNASESNPANLSYKITNANAALAVSSGWMGTDTQTRKENTGYDGIAGFFEFCNWWDSSWSGSISQTITGLPSGKYRVRAAGQQSADNTTLTLSANGLSADFPANGTSNGTILQTGEETTAGSGVAGWQYAYVDVAVTSGSLTIEASSTGSAQYRWANIDNFELYYLGALPPSSKVLSSVCAEQTYSESTATSDDICSIIDVDISNFGKSVKAVSIKSNNGVSLSGNFTYDRTNKVLILTDDTLATYCKNTVQSDVIRVVDIPSSATIARFYILPVMLTGGITVTVEDEDGNSYTKTFTDDLGRSSHLKFSVDGLASGSGSAPYYKMIEFGAASDVTRTNNWMATIPSNIYFSQLSTPGAHNAATSSVTGVTKNYVKCQDDDISTQLKNGVRCFDLRPGYKYSETITASNLYIYHGTYNTEVLYVDAMKTFVDFLKANPTEVISIIMVKEASSGTDYSDAMYGVINACHSEYSAYMKILDHSYYTLGDFRGKMCYINRNGGDVTNATKITNWPDDGTISDYSCVLGLHNASVQDKYNTNGTDKQTAIEEMLQQSSSCTTNKNMHFNFCSSAWSLLGKTPSEYAAQTNPTITSYLNGNNISGPTGYLCADFIGCSTDGGSALLHAIINQNYKYVFSNRTYNSAPNPIYPQSLNTGDLNKDNKVDIVDVAELIKAIDSSATPTNGIGDMNGNGTFDLEDVDLMIKEILSGK